MSEPIGNVTPLRPAAPAPRIVLVNDEAEMALIGVTLHDNRCYGRVAEFLRPKHFGNRVHDRIWTAIGAKIEAGQLADPITLKAQFEADGDLAGIGGFGYLARLAGSLASAHNAEDYARAILDLHRRRELLAIADTLAASAQDGSATAEAAALIAEEGLFDAIGRGEDERAVVPLAAALDRALGNIERARSTPSGLVGITTGLLDLDRHTGGLQAPELVVVGGRPGMGKSALGMTVARAAVTAQGPTPTLLFSLEMGADQLGQRTLADVGGVSVERQRRGDVNDIEMNLLRELAGDLRGAPLWIDDGGDHTIGQLRTRARRLKRRHGIGLVIVDYLQLVAGSGRSDNRVQDVSDISRGLKQLAQELVVPVLALSQLNRGLEARDEKRPMLSDLRESGSIEQDADTVWFCYREEYYLKKREPKTRGPKENDTQFMGRLADWNADMVKVRGIGEIIIAKGRNYEERTIACFFDGARAVWGNLQRGGK